MSIVTNIFLLMSLAESEGETESVPPVKAINAWLDERERGMLFKVSNISGGTKAMEAIVFAGAFNGLNLHQFYFVVAEQEWHSPENVQLLVKGENDEDFTLFSLSDAAHFREERERSERLFS